VGEVQRHTGGSRWAGLSAQATTTADPSLKACATTLAAYREHAAAQSFCALPAQHIACLQLWWCTDVVLLLTHPHAEQLSVAALSLCYALVAWLCSAGKEPTIVSPKQYMRRFRTAISSYFTVVPDGRDMDPPLDPDAP
jgi:hypothetical protein